MEALWGHEEVFEKESRSAKNPTKGTLILSSLVITTVATFKICSTTTDEVEQFE